MTRPPSPGPSLTDLVARARKNDEDAWRLLVDRLKNVVWKTVNGFSMGSGDADDAFAATMFRLAENLDRIRDPERLPGWLATTARNESLGLLRARRRTIVTDQPPEVAVESGEHERSILRDELREAVRQAFANLSHECQHLLRLLTGDPPMPYQDVAEFLGMPVGSIGPTRQRCLDKLRSQPPIRTYIHGNEQ